jgi:hypothetical protein
MAKETVRYPDALVARIETFVTDSSAFESKSEYHRFASDFLLSLLYPEHDPSVLGYSEIFNDIEGDIAPGFDRDGGADERFLETYIRVRRHLLRGDLDEARAVVDETYDVTDREALLLDEVIGQARPTEGAAAVSDTPHTPPGDRKRESNGRLVADGVDSAGTAQDGEKREHDAGRSEESTVASDDESAVASDDEPAAEPEHRSSHPTADGGQ